VRRPEFYKNFSAMEKVSKKKVLETEEEDKF
jgi:hypothetical protein